MSSGDLMQYIIGMLLAFLALGTVMGISDSPMSEEKFAEMDANIISKVLGNESIEDAPIEVRQIAEGATLLALGSVKASYHFSSNNFGFLKGIPFIQPIVGLFVVFFIVGAGTGNLLPTLLFAPWFLWQILVFVWRKIYAAFDDGLRGGT